MPLYVYRCVECGVTFERRQSFHDHPLAQCPECDGHVRRVIQPVGIVHIYSPLPISNRKKPGDENYHIAVFGQIIVVRLCLEHKVAVAHPFHGRIGRKI